jgi:hypothetical protein
MMDRRRFLLTTLVGVLAVPVVGEAQQTGKVYRIGVLGNPTAATPFGHRIYEAFRQGCATTGSSKVRTLPSSGGTRKVRRTDTSRSWPSSSR